MAKEDSFLIIQCGFFCHSSYLLLSSSLQIQGQLGVNPMEDFSSLHS